MSKKLLIDLQKELTELESKLTQCAVAIYRHAKDMPPKEDAMYGPWSALNRQFFVEKENLQNRIDEFQYNINKETELIEKRTLGSMGGSGGTNGSDDKDEDEERR